MRSPIIFHLWDLGAVSWPLWRQARILIFLCLAVTFYKNSLILGFDALETILRLLKIAFSLNKEYAIIGLVTGRYNAFKGAFLKERKLKTNRAIKKRDKAEKKMRAIEKMLSMEEKDNVGAR